MKKVQLSPKFIIILVLLFSFADAQAQWGQKVTGNGNLKTENRSVGNFEYLEVSGSFDVELIDGKEGDLSIRADENLMEYIETENEGGTLKIKWKKNYNISTRNATKITLAVDEISAAKLSGSGEIVSAKMLKSEEFVAAVSGSGDLFLKLDVGQLNLTVSGSGDMEISGNARKFEARVSGSGDIDAKNLTTLKADLAISGSGGIVLSVQDELVARVSGSGDIRYQGNPKIQDIKVSGSGEISKI